MVAGSELIFGSVLPPGATPPGTDQRLAPIENGRFGTVPSSHLGSTRSRQPCTTVSAGLGPPLRCRASMGGGLGLHLTMPPVFGSRQRCRCIFAASDPIGQSTMASRAAADAENDILTFLRNDLIAVDRSITLSTSAAGRQAGRPSGAALRRGRYRRIAAHGLASGTPRRRTAHAIALLLLATARGQRIPPSVNQEDEGVTPPVRTRPGSLNEH